MLKKGRRLRKKDGFERAFRNGKPLFFGELACKYTENNETNLRLGFSLSAKHIPLAVERNRIRRVVSEMVNRLGMSSFPVDIVFFSVKKLEKGGIERLKSTIESALRALIQKL